MRYGYPVKAEIINRRTIVSPTPEARIIMSDRSEWIVRQGPNGPELLLIGDLDPEQMEAEFPEKPRNQ